MKTFSDFNSQHLQKPSYTLSTWNQDEFLNLQNKYQEEAFFADLKVNDTHCNKQIINEAKSLGFIPICKQLTFSFSITEFKTYPSFADIHISDRLNLEKEIIKQHAMNFTQDRFSLDPNILLRNKIELMSAWIKNSTTGKKRIIHFGFNFISFTEEHDTIKIDLVTIIDKHQKIATHLLENLKHHALKHRKKHIIVTTEENNLPAVSLYKKCGFKLINKNWVLHYHNDLL